MGDACIGRVLLRVIGSVSIGLLGKLHFNSDPGEVRAGWCVETPCRRKLVGQWILGSCLSSLVAYTFHMLVTARYYRIVIQAERYAQLSVRPGFGRWEEGRNGSEVFYLKSEHFFPIL